MTFIFGKTSQDRLRGVHPDLVKVAALAIQKSSVDFRIQEGVRTKAKQAEYVRSGASQTMNSRHLTGHAVDVVALVNGKVRWDWPLYYKIADAFKAAAKELNIPIKWGGDWKSFKDGPHFELDRRHYP